MPVSLDLRRRYLFALEDVVREVGEKVLGYSGIVEDTQHVRGHEESSVDRVAYSYMHESLENHLGKIPKEDRFKGSYYFELHELQDIPGDEIEGRVGTVLRIDEIDGTTNVKRGKASVFQYAPAAAVSLALCEDETLGSSVIGAVYDMQNRNVFSGIKVDEDFMAFCDRKLLNPRDFESKQGDTCTRIIVTGYSNTERIKKGELEQALVNADPSKKDFRIYDGSRSTAMDILSIIRNQFDAYIDARGAWEGSGAMLYSYDVAGVIPVARGCGLEVGDIRGNSIDYCAGKSQPLTIIIARRGMSAKFAEILKPVLDRQLS